MPNRIKVLLVEDSRADARLIQEVFSDEKISVNVNVVRDGEQALCYLRKQGEYENSSRPDLILLDLNMPKKDGREVLAEIKTDPVLGSIPVVILTTPRSEEDILKSYKLQASCFVTKPIDLEQFVEIIRSLDGFWFSAVRYPAKQ
jgi:two-component system, chemotaxis family, response regulator Rcp1